jgi:hypothetical protein
MNSLPAVRPSRLLYIGDVPVANTVAGAVQLVRILSGHPPDCLRVVESSLSRTLPGQELPGVQYDCLNLGTGRFLKSRFAGQYSTLTLAAAGFRGRRVAKKYRSFHPDAVLTVAHQYSWLSAAAAAKSLGLPLHLIVHDEPLAGLGLPASVRRIGARVFADVYRTAATRLVVSAGMAEAYKKKFGVDADVLYPLWPPGDSPFDGPPQRSVPAGRPLGFAYAGSLFSSVYLQRLIDLAKLLLPMGHRIAWWTDWTPEQIRDRGMALPNVDPIRPAAPGRLVHELRDRADVLFVPMDFDPATRAHQEVNFPSKLTDYTAAALPILMWAPVYSGAGRWATENPDAVTLADQADLQSLQAAVDRIAADPETRRRAGQAALDAGRKYFGSEVARRVLAPVLTTAVT